MFTRNELKTNLFACFEVFLFMRRGISRFEVSHSAAVKSFIITFLTCPATLILMSYLSPGVSYNLVFSLNMARLIFAGAFFLTAVYFLVQHFGRAQHFYRFMLIWNWMNLPFTLLLLPVLWGIALGSPMENLESYSVFITLTGYVYSAFIITSCFRIPWEMGGFITIIGMAIDHNLWNLTLRIQETLV